MEETIVHPIIVDLNKRYSTKKYDATKRVSEDDMAVIKEALRMSASSVNSQPWMFIVIESDEAKQRMKDTFVNKFQMNRKHATETSHIILFAHNPYFTVEQYKMSVDAEVSSGHLPTEKYDEMVGKGTFFIE